VRLSEDRIRNIIREEILRRYKVLSEQENLDEKSGSGLAAATAAGAGTGAAVGAVSGAGLFSWLTAPVGAAIGGLVGATSYALMSRGDDSEISADAKTNAAFLIDDPDAWSKLEGLMRGGELSELDVVSSSDMRKAAAALNDAFETPGVFRVGTDEDKIRDTLDALPTILDISGVSQHYADTYNEPLIKRLKKELSDSDMRTYVYVVINDKPLAQVDGKRIDTSEEFMEALAPEGEEGEGVSGEDSEGISALQTALGSRVTGELSQQNYESVIDEIEDNYSPSSGQPSKRAVMADFNKHVTSGSGGTRSFQKLGYNARSDYYGAVAKFITNKGAAPSDTVSEAKRAMAKKKLRSLINSVSRDILGEGLLNEIEVQSPSERFPDDAEEVESSEEEETTTRRRSSRSGRYTAWPGWPAPIKLLHKGPKDGPVGQLQTKLEVKVDGFFGPNSVAALKAKHGGIAEVTEEKFQEIVGGSAARTEEEEEEEVTGTASVTATRGRIGQDPGAGGSGATWDARGTAADGSALPRAVVQEIGQLVASLAQQPGVVNVARRKHSIQILATPRASFPGPPSPQRQSIKREVRAQNVPVDSSIIVTVKRA